MNRITPLLYIAATLLACIPVGGHSSDWTVDEGVARTGTLFTTDGRPATIEVSCQETTQVRLLHEGLVDLPVEKENRRPGWYGIVLLSEGWGLDFTRPDHHGMRTAWWPCRQRKGCLLARDTGFTLQRLKRDWTLFIRFDPPGRPALDMRFSLMGSRAAIEKACLGERPQTILRSEV